MSNKISELGISIVEKEDKIENKLFPDKKIIQKEIIYTSINSGESCELGPLTVEQRRNKAFRIRKNAAFFQKNFILPGHPNNGDEDLYFNKIAS